VQKHRAYILKLVMLKMHVTAVTSVGAGEVRARDGVGELFLK